MRRINIKIGTINGYTIWKYTTHCAFSYDPPKDEQDVTFRFKILNMIDAFEKHGVTTEQAKEMILKLKEEYKF